MVSSMPFRIFWGGVVGELNGVIVKAEDELVGVEDEPVRAEDGLANIKAEILAFEETGFGGSLDVVIDKVLSSGRLVFLYFYADWCHFCKLEKAIIDELEEIYSEKVVFIRINEARNKLALEEFGVEGFPTMFLVYGKVGSTYLYHEFRGFKDKGFLENVIAQMVEGNFIVIDQAEKGQCLTLIGGLFNHESCSFWDCVKECTNRKERNWDAIIWELCETLMGCVDPGILPTIYSCGKALITDDVDDWIGCALGVLEALKKIPEKTGCAYSISHLLADLLGAKEIGECLGECAASPGSYGQVCQPGEERFVCIDDTFYKKQVCSSECEWVTVPGSVRFCGAGKKCAMNGGGATCVDIDICEVEPSLPQCNNPDNFPVVPPTYPGMDMPDDNYDVSTLTYQNNAYSSLKAGNARIVAVLNRGYYSGIASFLEGLNQSYTLVTLSSLGYLDPKKYPVLIVASGGFYGLTSSFSARQNLESYVGKGGKLIVFSQQRGVDYGVLPGGEVRGFGWVEDQSCWGFSSIISTYHPIVSGQELKASGFISIHVDGFFTSFPSNAITILTRAKSGTPSLILYGYEKGYVLAGTLYSDVQWFYGQYSLEEVAILRDMVLWALSEDKIETYTFSYINEQQVEIPFMNPVAFSPSWPKFRRGDVVTIPVNVTNYGSTAASRVVFTLIDPYYNYWYLNVSASISPNGWRIVNLNYSTTSASSPGIWMVLYTLYNGSGKIWSGYHGAFTLDVDINDFSSFTAELTFISPSVNWTSYGYRPSMTVRKVENISFYASPSETVLINTTFTPDSLGIWIISYQIKTLSGITVRTGSLFLAVSLYDENPYGWSYASMNIRSSITTDEEAYFMGENATYTIHIWNHGNKTQNIIIAFGLWFRYPYSIWGIYESAGAHVVYPGPDLERNVIINTTIAAVSYINYTFVWPFGFDPPDIAKPYNFTNWHQYNFLYLTVFNGTYTKGILGDGYYVLSKCERYLRPRGVPYHFDGVKAIELDKTFYNVGENVTATVKIVSENPKANRLKLKFQVYDFVDDLFFEEERILEVPPAIYGPIIVSSTIRFTLPATVNLTALTLLGLRTPFYRIQADFLLTIAGREVSVLEMREWGPVSKYFYVEPFAGMNFSSDKSQYKVRDEMTLTFSFFNKLSNPTSSRLKVNIPDIGYTNITAIEIPPQQENWILIMKVILPSSIDPGYHEILVNFEVQNITRGYLFWVSGSYLNAEPIEEIIKSNELGLRIQNTGGVDTNYTYSIKVFGSYGYPTTTHIIYEEAGASSIQAGESITRSYTIPEDVVKMTPAQWIKDGFYKIFWINIELEDLSPPYPRKNTIRLIYYLISEPPSMLTATPEKLSYALGERIGVEIRNIGGSAANYIYALQLFDFPLVGGTIKLYEGSGSGRLEAGEKTTVRFTFPNNAVKGVYYLKVDLQNLNNLRNSSDLFIIHVEGLNAVLKSETDKKVYSLEENITVKTEIENLDGMIQNATLNLQISGKKPCVIPHDDMYINEDTVLCQGTYSIKDAGTQGVLIINASNIVLDCNGAVLNGIDKTGYAIISFGWNDNVTIKNCKIINYDYGLYLNYAHNNIIINNEIQDMGHYGITLTFSSSNIIFNNTITNCYYGIYLARGDQNIAVKNTLQSSIDAGIYIYTEEDDIIAKNTFIDNLYGISFNALSSYYPNENMTIAYNHVAQSREHGIYMRYTMNSLIFNNTIISSQGSGICITTSQSKNNLIVNNTVEKNAHGVYLYVPTTVPPTTPPTNNVIASNIIRNNTQHGVYLENIQNTTIINNLIGYNGYSGIYLAQVNSINIFIANNTIEFNAYGSGAYYTYYGGIHMLRSANNTIIGNTVKSNKYYGIYLGGAKNNTIANNIITGNNHGIYSEYQNIYPANNGIYLNNIENNNIGIYGYSLFNSTIASNIIRNNLQEGIILYSNGNSIVNNTIAYNKIGITVSASAANNRIYHNNFLNNTSRQVYDYGASIWDNGYPSGGNYWSDYTGVDNNGDGIGDTPYIIDSNSQDNYPFIKPNSWAPFQIQVLNITFSLKINVPSIIDDPSAPDPPSQGEGSIIWERNLNVTVVDKLSLNTFVGQLGITGKFYLTARLYSSSTQMIAWDTYAFYITESDIHLIMKTDKKIYKPGENITIYGEVKNRGNTAKTLTLTIKKNETQIYSESFTLEPNNSRPYTLFTFSNTSFTLEGSVDGFTATEFIRIAEPQIHITLIAPNVVGREPFIVTLEIQNKGELPANLNVTLNGHKYSVTIPANQTTLIQTEITINKNTTLTVTITGDYSELIQKEVIFGENIQMAVYPHSFYLEGIVDIPYNLTNIGILDTSFNITFTINGETVNKTIFIPVGESIIDAVNFNLTKGKYLLRYQTPFQEGNATINVETPAEFIVTTLPENETFQLGQTATLTVIIKNIGGTAGTVQANITVPGITELTNSTFILPGREGRISFSFEVPDDLEEKYYKAIFEIGGKKYEVKFFVQGIKIAVNAWLDKKLYEEGENATLILRIDNLREMNLTLFSRVVLGGYEAIKYFNLSSYETKELTFCVPVVFDAGKLSYSIYMTSGRALYINALYIYPKTPESAGIILYTDKQVYTIGETVTVYANVTRQGQLTMTAPNLNVNTTVSSGMHIFTFEVPKLRSGTYLINYIFEGYQSFYPVDIIGYSARIISSEIENKTYSNGDVISLTLIIDANRNFEGLVKAWVFDPQDKIVGEGEANHTFTIGENKVKLSIILNTNITGLHAIAYRVYAYGSFILLSSGATYFNAEVPVTAPPDTTPPQIGYVDVTNALNENRPITQNEPIAINAIVTDNFKVEKVTLYYRKAGQQSYTKIVMTICPGCIDTYNATIPASQVTTATIEFYINATDGTNYATYPAANPTTNPQTINVNLYPTPVVLNQPTDITENSMKLSWTQSVDADFKNYTIYRSSASGILGTAIHTITQKSTTFYTVTGLTADTKYYFTVRVYDTGGLYADSNQVSGKTLAAAPPPVNLPPTAVVLNPPTEITENSMKLSWTESIDADFKNYTIYQSNTAGSLGTPIYAITTKSTTSYTVKGLTADTTYYFTIRVYDTGGLFADSNQVSAKTLETQQQTPLQPPAQFPWALITIGVFATTLIIVISAVMIQKRKRTKK